MDFSNKFESILGFGDGGGGVHPTKDIKNYSLAELGSNPSINLATGRLRYSFADTAVGHGSFAIGISHVYVSSIYSGFTDKFNFYGSGWKLNLSQCILKEDDNLLYMDEGGEVHRFIKFDDSRYYDERNAKTTLTANKDGYVITDGIGNKLCFNSNGLLCKSVSCHNDNMVKIYSYDESNRLISVYDQRTRATSNLTKNRIDLSYGNANKKLSEITYEYDESKRLIAVRKTAFDNSSNELESKQLFAFRYNGDFLYTIIDCETDSAQKFLFNTEKRVFKASNGIMRNYLPSSEANDSAETTHEETFTEIKSNNYKYSTFPADKVAYETDITNENGVTIAYFIDRNACITSSFEKMPDGKLKTLTKQGAKRTGLLDGSADYINGKRGLSHSGTLNLTFNQSFNVARNNLEESCKYFNYSFWLKTSQMHTVLEAQLTCVFDGYPDSKSKVYVNANAKKVWQKVSLPITVPTDSKGNHVTAALKSLKIDLFANKYDTVSADSYEINEIGFAPAPLTELQLCRLDGYFPLQSVDKVKYASNILSLTKDFYFTESDVMATFTNKFKNLPQIDFDIICNSGTRRIKVDEIWFGFGENWTNESDAPYKTVMHMPNDQYAEVIYGYNFIINNCDVLQNMVVTIQSDNGSGLIMQGSTVSDYFGNVLLESDAYGVTKKYHYNNYGDLQNVKTIARDGTLGPQSVYVYDVDGRLTDVHGDLRGQHFNYDDHGQIVSVTSAENTGNGVTATSHRVDNLYGVFHEKTLSSTEFDGTNQLAQNKITYCKGRISTVSDGTVKYGVEFDDENNTVICKQFDGNNEKILQKDSVSALVDELQTHKSEFFSNGVLNALTSLEMDKYGKTIKSDKRSRLGNSAETYVYEYNDIAESQFANEPTKVTSDDGTFTEYTRDDDGNLVSVSQRYPQDKTTGTAKLIFGIQQIAENTTRYMFEDDSNQYFTSVVTDPKKTSNPRIDSVKNMWYRNALTDYQVKDYPLFCQQYTYDKFGRLLTGDNQGYYSCAYEYLNNTDLLKSVKYRNTMPLKEGMGSAGNVDLKHDESIEYFTNGLPKSIVKDYSSNVFNITSSGKVKEQFQYDKAHRLVQDISASTIGSTTAKLITNYTYRSDGRLSNLKQTDETGKTLTKAFSYDSLGRLSQLSDNLGNSTSYSYDTYGNRTQQKRAEKTEYRYTYKFGDKLSKISSLGQTCEYKYNVDGIRTKKSVNGVITKYFTDGSKILREIGKNTITYFYGKDGLIGFRIGSDEYTYVRDCKGNISMLFSVNKPNAVARYEYDIFGNCTVYDGNNVVNADPNFIGNVNPFRWKSFYFDVESGLYYANGSYYDPKTGLYLDASPVSAIFDNAYSTRSLDRNAPLCNNMLELAGSPSTAFTETDLSPDPNYNFENSLPDWLLRRRKRQQKLAEAFKWYQDLHWGWKLGIGLGLLIGAALLTFFSGSGWLGVLGVVAQVAIGVGVGVGIYFLGALFGFYDFSLEGLGNAALDSFLASSAIAFVSSGVSFIKSLSRSSNISSSTLKDCTQCFIAGTLVHCEDGLKKIEDVQIGDKVLAYNEEIGEQAYKIVLHLFRNESKDWVGITVEDKEIVSTPGHKYYLPLTKQWVSAKDLKVGDTVLLSNGQLAKVQSTRSIHYDTPQTTYNFEVEDFHTYYVGDGVCVHNKNCIFDELNVKDFTEAAQKYSPDQLVNKLDELGFSKNISFKSANSGPATIMKRNNLTFRIQTSPTNGHAYFRVYNGVNPLSANGIFPSWATSKEVRILTHFYFGG